MKIKVTGYINPDNMDPEDIDLAHSMGLSNEGYESLSAGLADLGIEGTEFKVEP